MKNQLNKFINLWFRSLFYSYRVVKFISQRLTAPGPDRARVKMHALLNPNMIWLPVIIGYSPGDFHPLTAEYDLITLTFLQHGLNNSSTIAS